MALPIQLPRFAPEDWRSLEKKLVAIANREKQQLEPRDRLVCKVLSLVQYAARAKKWSEVSKLLSDRHIIVIKPDVSLLQLITAQKMAIALGEYKPQPKAVKVVKPKPKTTLLQWLTAQAMAIALGLYRPEPRLPRQRKRVKALKPKPRTTLLQWITAQSMAIALGLYQPKRKKEAKVKRRRVNLKKRFTYPQFAFNSFGWLVFNTIINFFAGCEKYNRGNPYRVTIEQRLKRTDAKGNLALRYLERFRIGCNVRSLLMSVSAEYSLNMFGTPRPRLVREKVGKRINKRKISKDVLDQALNQYWQGIGAIAKKLTNLLGRDVTFDECKKLLERRTELGEVYQRKGKYPIALYSSNPDATIIERDWLTLSEAYAFACENGYTASINTFRKNHVIKYSKYNLEFRKEVPAYDNSLLRWRMIA